MKFDKIIHATQYYRAPTPKREEWDGDISRLADISVDTFQIRINWRWNERVEGVYDCSDVDELFDLAEKHGKRVIIKFLLECAPQYVFDKYGGTIIGPKGEQIRGGSHGAFYGGWKPCFTNPDVQKRASLFVEEVVKRYKDRECLVLYNAWNEIRNKPVEECFCKHCRTAFGRYLSEKFGTVESLNAFYGAAEESFESIALPSMPHGYWDIFEFKKFKGSYELYNYLTFVREAVRRHDITRPVMSHTGFCSAFQTHIGDVCDDFGVSRAVDFFGTSIPCLCNMDTEDKRLDFLMLNDYVRSVDRDYFLYEIYPGLGMFSDEYDTPFDMSFKLYVALASGAKGLVYWQYRAERVGMENDCAGLMRADGTPRAVAGAVADFGRDLERDMRYLRDVYPERADVAILFDFDSMLLSEIEDACGDNYSFRERKDPLHYYMRSHSGMYRLLTKSGVRVDYLSTRESDKLSRYKAVYLPYYNMLSPDFAERLSAYVRGGGTVIADEGFGLREMNTWLQPYDVEFSAVRMRMRERRQVRSTVLIGDTEVTTAPFRTEYALDGADTVLTFTDGTPAVISVDSGEGRIYLCSFGLGYTYRESADERLATFVTELLGRIGVSRDRADDFERGVYIRTAVSEKYAATFVLNCSDEPYTVTLREVPAVVSEGLALDGLTITAPPKTAGYYVAENK